MSPRKPIIRTLASVTVLVVLAAACSRGDSIESTDASTTTDSAPPTSEPVASSVDPSSSIPETTLDTSTTVATTTTVAETTTTEAVTTTTVAPLTVADLMLARNGVLPFVFGDTDARVITGLSAVLGATVFDNAHTYVIPEGDYLLDAAEEQGYKFPVGRYVCFANDLCVQFGGATTDTLTFTGWDLSSDAAPQLFTTDGVTVGANLAAFAAVITVEQGGCFTNGYGETAGVGLSLLSTGDPFIKFENDEYVFLTPAPADVTVIQMHAGELPFFQFADC